MCPSPLPKHLALVAAEPNLAGYPVVAVAEKSASQREAKVDLRRRLSRHRRMGRRPHRVRAVGGMPGGRPAEPYGHDAVLSAPPANSTAPKR